MCVSMYVCIYIEILWIVEINEDLGFRWHSLLISIYVCMYVCMYVCKQRDLGTTETIKLTQLVLSDLPQDPA